MKKTSIIALSFLLVSMAVSCLKATSPKINSGHSRRGSDHSSNTPSKYGITEAVLPEYEQQETHVVPGLGGKWMTYRYVVKEKKGLERSAMLSRIRRALAEAGWRETRNAAGNKKYGMCRMYEHNREDVVFTRPTFSDEDDIRTYKQVVHISENANIVVVYLEWGW